MRESSASRRSNSADKNLRRARILQQAAVEALEQRTLLSISPVSGHPFGTSGVTPSLLATVGGYTYFNQTEGGAGLWRTDGTTAGTVRLASFAAQSVMPMGGGVVFVSSASAPGGAELWTSDGTAAGTHVLKDINPGSASSNPGQLTALNGAIYFAANDAVHGQELWKTDGTAAGTVIVQDINPGSATAQIASMVSWNGQLYFAANDGAHGSELWKSDGTAAGTVLVADVNINTSQGTGVGSSPTKLTPAGDALYFLANDGTHGQELWKTDGTAAGTVLIDDVNPGASSSSIGTIVPLNGAVYFTAFDGSHGAELWRTDGTTAGTAILKDINPGTASASPATLTLVNGRLCFEANDGTDGTEWWGTDGTSAGTQMLGDLAPGTAGIFPIGSVVAGNRLFFGVQGSATPQAVGLWETDGTPAGTVHVDTNPVSFLTAFGSRVAYAVPSARGWDYDLYAVDAAGGTPTRVGSTSFTRFGAAMATPTQLFFGADDGVDGMELWQTDGTIAVAGTTMVGDLNTTPVLNTPALPTVAGGKGYYTANGLGLYSTDLATGAVSKLATSAVSQIVAMGGRVYFTLQGNDGPMPSLWVTDGTRAGTTLVAQMPLGYSSDGTINQLTAVGNMLYFGARTATSGARVLWASDGTPAGTAPVQAAGAPVVALDPNHMTGVGNAVLFFARDAADGNELWRTDGTSAGTYLVTDANPGTGDAVPASPGFTSNPVVLNGVLLYAAESSAGNYEPWRSDGTAAGTYALGDLDGNASTGSFINASFALLGGKAYFLNTQGLWSTDGTVAGTQLVTAVSGASQLAAVGNRLMFTTGSAFSVSLWKSDGTAAGTTVVKAVYTNSASAFPGISSIVDFNSTAYFAANNPLDGSGTELWQSDGTASGTHLVKDLSAGSTSSNPGSFVVTPDALYFIANDGSPQPRLLALTQPTTAPAAATGLAVGSAGPATVVLNWSDNAGGGAMFRLQRSSTPDFATLDLSVDLPYASTTYTDTSVSPGTTYYYRVIAFDGSAVSSVAAAPTLAVTAPTLNTPGVTQVAPGNGYWYVTNMQPLGSSRMAIWGYSPSLSSWCMLSSDGSAITNLGQGLLWSAVVGNKVYFILNTSDKYLCVSDGTLAGTRMLTEFRNVTNLVTYNGQLLFRGDGVYYTNNATNDGIVAVTPGSDPVSSYVTGQLLGQKSLDLAKVNGLTIFPGTSPTGSIVPFASDGTAAGTVQLTASTTALSPRDFVAANGHVYFFAGNQLWVTDGTPASTKVVYPYAGATAGQLLALDGTLYFLSGSNLWTSDGTTGGMAVVFGALDGQALANLSVVGGRLYFTAATSSNAGNPLFQDQLYVSDGTYAGTVPVSGLPTTPAGLTVTTPGLLTPLGPAAFMSGTTPTGAIGQLLLLVTTPSPFAAPADPSSFVATPVSTYEIDLSWSDNATNEEGYVLQRSTDPSFATIDATFHFGSNVASYNDTGLPRGTTYYYRLWAYNEGGTTATLSVGPVATQNGPLAPSDLAAGNGATPGKTVNLTWVDHATDATGYVLQRSNSSDFSNIQLSVTLPADATSYTDTTVSRLTQYYYRVYAFNGGGNSPAVSTVFTTSDTIPNAPSFLRAHGVSGTEIDLGWVDYAFNEAVTNGYRVERAGSDGVFQEIAQLPEDTTTYVDRTASPLATYTYRVRAVNSAGASAYCAPVTATTLPPSLATPVVELPPLPSGTSTNDADPSAVVDVNGVGFFVAENYSVDPRVEYVYRTDGTAGGTLLLKTFPSVTGAALVPAGAANGLFYFTGVRTVGGTQMLTLWSSDGTPDGTVDAVDLEPFSQYAGQKNVTGILGLGSVGVMLLLGAPGSTNQSLLLLHPDHSLTTIATWSGTSTARGIIHWHGADYIKADRLYKVDPATGTIVPSSDPLSFFDAASRATTADGRVFYTDNSGSVFLNDGSGNPDVALPITGAFIRAALGNQVLYTTQPRDATGKLLHNDLWITDGTAAGTTLIKEFDYGGDLGVTATLTVGNTLYFGIIGNGSELWKTDGTAAGTVMVSTVPGNIDRFGEANGMLTFRGGGPNQLWSSDGTAAGTGVLTNIGARATPAVPDQVMNVNGLVYFVASTTQGLNTNNQLWRTDGTAAGTVLLFSGVTGGPTDLENLNGTLYFLSRNQLWKTDGTPQGTQLVQDLQAAAGGQTVRLLTVFKGSIYFVADTSTFTLWKTDGTANGATLVGGNVAPPSWFAHPSDEVAASGDYLYFVTPFLYGSPVGALARTDGTPGNITTSSPSLLVSQMVDWNGTLYAVGYDSQWTQGGLYRIDPATMSATLLLNRAIYGLTVAGNALYFNAGYSATAGGPYTVWTSDGTVAGTRRLPNVGGQAGLGFAAIGGQVYILTSDTFSTSNTTGATGEVLRTDGTTTFWVADVHFLTPNSPSTPIFGTSAGGKYIYSDGEFLWRSDGTPAGTFQIEDERTAPDGSISPSTYVGKPYTVVGDRIYYSAASGGGARDLHYATLTPPATPAGLSVSAAAGSAPVASATPAAAGTGGPTLTWTAGDTTQTGFLIERSSTAAFTTVDASYFVPATQTAFTDPSPGSGILYYRVRAVNAGGNSAPSNVATFDGRPAFLLTAAAAGSNFLVRLAADGASLNVWQDAAAIAAPTAVIPLAGYSGVRIQGGDGNDTVTLDFSAGNPLLAAGLSFDGAGGANAVHVIGTTGDDTVTLAADGTLTFASAALGTLPAVQLSGVSAVHVDAGTGGADAVRVTGGSWQIDAGAPAGTTPNVSIEVDAGAAVTLASDQRLAGLTINGGSLVLSSPSASTLSLTGTLSITEGGTLDLGAGSLLLPTTSAANIRAYIAQAAGTTRTGGVNAWDGTGGLTSSVVKADAANNNAKALALGYFDSRDNTPTGVSVPAGDTLVKYTVYGDATGDGVDDTADFTTWRNNFFTGSRWSQGDFNYDGVIDTGDFTIWRNNFFKHASADASPSTGTAATASPATAPVIAVTSTSATEVVTTDQAGSSAASATSDASPAASPLVVPAALSVAFTEPHAQSHTARSAGNGAAARVQAPRRAKFSVTPIGGSAATSLVSAAPPAVFSGAAASTAAHTFSLDSKRKRSHSVL